MKVDTFAVRYQHSLFLVVTFLSMGMCESLTAQSHQAHAHTRLMDTSKKITPLQLPTWHRIAHVNMNPFNGFMFSFSISFKVCWQISYLATNTHTPMSVCPGQETPDLWDPLHLWPSLLAATAWSW